MSAPAAALITFAGMAVLIAVLYLFVLPRQQHAATESPSPAATQIEPAASAAPAHPLAKYLEVAGVRLKGSPGGKVTIQFLVVNHSAADLPPMKMAVTLGSADRTYFEFGAAVPSLGPYEVKDMTTTATTDLKPYEMPDWQALRANFRITE